MDQDIYFWIYGLSEALALCLAAIALLGFHWQRQRKQRSLMERAWREVLKRLDEEVETAQKDPQRRLELRDIRVACFKAFSAPLQSGRTGEAKVWYQAIDNLNQSLDKIVSRPPRADAPPDPESDLEPEPTGESEQDWDGQALEASCPDLDTEIGLLLSQHDRGVATLHASRGVAIDLTRKCEEIRLANQNLRVKLESVAKQDHGGHIQRMLDEIEQSNLDLQQIAFATERHHSSLGPQLDALGQQIRNLQLSIKNYRKSLQKLLVDRDALAEEKKALAGQLETKIKLIERLNRNYDVLRREYTKLYESTR